MYHIGLDIGGTKISLLAQNAKREELSHTQEPVEKNYSAFLGQIKNMVQKARPDPSSPYTLGISIAGRILKNNNGKQIEIKAANLPFLAGHDLNKDLTEIFGFAPTLENDANCFALSEALSGNGAEENLVFGLILGTGLGGGIVANKQILAGANHLAGEWGHIPMPYRKKERDGEAVPCACGQTGCMDFEFSSRGLTRRYEMLTGVQMTDSKEVVRKIHQNEPEAISAYRLYLDALAENLGLILLTVDPDIIIIGGGLKCLPNLTAELESRLKSNAHLAPLSTKITLGKYGADSGVRAALYLGQNQVTACSR